jgi:hypothetical protein
VRMISIASLRKMVSNSRVNLLLRVARANTRSCLRMGQIPLTLGPSRD